MKCANCHNQAHHIVLVNRKEQCENCGGLPTISPSKTDGILTRNSWRIRRQQSRYEGDFVQPHIYDKNTRKQVINPEFVKLYPKEAETYYQDGDFTSEYKDLPKAIKKRKAKREKLVNQAKRDTIYEGSSDTAVEKFLKD